MNVKMHVGVHPGGRMSVSIQASRKGFKLICVTFGQATSRGVSGDTSGVAENTYVFPLLAQPTGWPTHLLLLIPKCVPSIPQPEIVDDAEHERLLSCVPLRLLGDEALAVQASNTA